VAADLLDTQAVKRGDRNDALPYSARGAVGHPPSKVLTIYCLQDIARPSPAPSIGRLGTTLATLNAGKEGTHLHEQAPHLPPRIEKNVSTSTTANTYIHHDAVATSACIPRTR
jgi:hypothetical protein